MHIIRNKAFKALNGLGHDDFHEQRLAAPGCVNCWGITAAIGMNPCLTPRAYPQTETEELLSNVPFSFHFPGFPPPGLQTVSSSALRFPAPCSLGTGSTELAPAPSCGGTAAHSHGQSLENSIFRTSFQCKLKNRTLGSPSPTTQWFTIINQN